ncbi:MAG: hypothetical protein I8H93_10670 [Pseudomonadales bacterium]|nr:hypothetical protein [Pseudomonadales bacterium]
MRISRNDLETPTTQPSSTTRAQDSSQSVPSIFMSGKEIAQLLGVVENTVRNWSAQGMFPAPVQPVVTRSTGSSGRVQWVRAEVMQWVQEQLAKPRHVLADNNANRKTLTSSAQNAAFKRAPENTAQRTEV